MLSDQPHRVQKTLDDIESCYWVFLYHAFHYFSSTADRRTLEMFDYCEDGYGDSEITGGAMKMQFLLKRRRPTFACLPLQALADSLHMQVKMFFADLSKVRVEVVGPAMLSLFDDALARTDWPEADVLQDRFPQQGGQEGHRSPIPAPRVPVTGASPPNAPSRCAKRQRPDDDSLHSGSPKRLRMQISSGGAR